MSGMVHIGEKLLSIQEAAEKLNNMGLVANDFSEAMHVFNLNFPLEFTKMSSDGCECYIRGSSQEITEAEAV